MATFKICVFEHQCRKDGKYPVSVRVCWKSKYGFISTEYYVSDKQINKKVLKLENGKEKRIFELKDAYIIKELNSRIVRYEGIKTRKLGYNIEQYTAPELARYLEREGRPRSDGSINFIEF